MAHAARRYPALKTISSEPGTARFGSFSFGHNGVPNIATAVSRYLTRAEVEEPGTVPLLATYRIVHGLCGHASDTPADVASYKGFIDGFAQGIGSYHAVLFLEMDSIITMGCLSRHGQAVREQELQYAINTLIADCPHLVIYLDAGAADALSARQAARYLRRSGVAKIQGFFLNATHFDWTSNEIRYGEQISRLTGGKHFVVNTGDERPRAAATARPRSLRATRSCATRPGAGSDRSRRRTPASRTSTCSRGRPIRASLAAPACRARRRPACSGPPTR